MFSLLINLPIFSVNQFIFWALKCLKILKDAKKANYYQRTGKKVANVDIWVREWQLQQIQILYFVQKPKLLTLASSRMKKCSEFLYVNSCNQRLFFGIFALRIIEEWMNEYIQNMSIFSRLVEKNIMKQDKGIQALNTILDFKKQEATIT